MARNALISLKARCGSVIVRISIGLAGVIVVVVVVVAVVIVGSWRPPCGDVLPRFAAAIDRGDGGGGRRIRGAGRGTCQFLCGFITRLAGGGNLLKPALSKTGSRSLTLCPAPIDASSVHLQ